MVHPADTPSTVASDANGASHSQALAKSLQEAFDAPFDLWQYREGWHTPNLPSHEGNRQPPPEWIALLDQAASSGEPQVLAQSDGSYTLAIPIAEGPTERLVATARLLRPGPPLLTALGRSVVDEHALRRQIASLRTDLDVSTQQINDDLEDIAFWRQLAERLDVGNHGDDVWSMAQSILPLIAEAIAAQTIVLVAAEGNKSDPGQVEVGQPAVWYGPAPIDENCCREIVTRWRQAAQTQPVVRNQQALDWEQLAGVRQCILTSVTKDEFFLGWLLAINRQRRADRMTGDNREGSNPLADLPGTNEFGSIEATLLASTATMFATHARNLHLLRERENLLLSAQRAKNAFLAGLSTRLQGPLSMILGFGRTLLETGESAASGQRQSELIGQMLSRGEKVLAVVENLLDLSRLEAGAVTPTAVAISPSGSIDEVACLMRGRAHQCGITLEVQHNYPQPAAITADPSRLRQILINLLDNAIKFSPRGNTVRLVSRFVPIDSSQRPAEPLMYFEVIDSGVGISPQRIGRLFEPFSRETPEGSSSGGLGLAISRRLARLLGGDLTVESVVGKGSTFRVVIPAGSLTGVKMLHAPAAASSGSQAESSHELPAGPLAQRRMLLVESEPRHQQLATLLLRPLGIQLTIATDGQTGMEHALVASDAGRPFDLALFNAQLPVLDGFEAAALLRKQGYSGTLVTLVERDAQQYRRRSEEAGCDELLAGPLDGERLLGLVRRHLTAPAVCRNTAEQR